MLAATRYGEAAAQNAVVLELLLGHLHRLCGGVVRLRLAPALAALAERHLLLLAALWNPPGTASEVT